LAIVIRDNVATAEYSIGLNESTLTELLAQWEKSEADSSQPEPLESTNADPAQSPDVSKPDPPTGTFIDPKPDSKTEISDPESKIQSNPKLKPGETEAGSQTKAGRVLNRQTSSPSAELTANSAVDESTGEPHQGKSLPQNDEEDKNPIHERLLATLKRMGPKQISRRIHVNCDGKPLKIKNVEASPAPRHPFNLVVKFEFELPLTKSVQLDIADTNFLRQTGAVRYAIKAAGSTMLVKSNAAPIIIRAKRVELAGLSRKETVSKTSISAKILLVSNSNKED